jgi:hypothetical protein
MTGEVETEAEEAVSAEVSEETQAPGKCTRQPAPTAATNAKYHSSRQKEGRSTAEIAFRNTKSSD